jgi:FtsP/CotA-like multicopper oxidase with cupredoxin domain
LLGPIVITSAKHAKPDGTPDDVDKEFVTMFMIFDESKPGMSATQQAGSMKYTINGYIFDNLQGLVMNKGDKVRWYLLDMGGEMDMHTPHWHGGIVLNRETNTYTDVMELLPGSMKTVDMLADNPGQWMYHCHVADHMQGGMTAMYTINP